ncbi:MAG: winged helix-turn-helix transcriptional regulator, partial [archaeon]
MVSNKQKTSFLTFSKRLNKEKMILIELRKNARKSFAEIARQQEIPVTTVFEIHQKLQEKIIKHTTLVDFEKIGFPIRALIAVNNNKKTLEWLKNREEVNNLHLSKNHLLA